MLMNIRQALGGVFTLLGDFATNETGFVRQRSGFSAAWVAGLLIAGAVVLGAPERAEATCIPGTSGYQCLGDGDDVYCEQVCRIFRGCNWGTCESIDPFWYCWCWD